MKKRVWTGMLACLMAVCLMGCGGGKIEPGGTSASDAAAETGYTFTYNGTKIAMHADAEAIVKALGVEENAYKIPSFGNARELGILKRIDAEIAEVIEGVENEVLLDLLSAILQNAYNDVRELLGEDATHDLTDEIFSRFCVGK